MSILMVFSVKKNYRNFIISIATINVIIIIKINWANLNPITSIFYFIVVYYLYNLIIIILIMIIATYFIKIIDSFNNS